MQTELIQHRKQASDQSLGSSHAEIYNRALELMAFYYQPNTALENHLDFGSGQGALLKRVHKSFPDSRLTGVDLMARPAELATEIQWLQGDLNGRLQVTDETFASITAIEVIEHLENPRHVLRELFRLLKKGGTLVLSTPNNESWRSILSYIVRGHFVAFTDSSYPAHITPLNRKDLARVAQEVGFKVEKVAFVEKGCVPGLTSLTWQQISGGLIQGLRYSDNFFVVMKK